MPTTIRRLLLGVTAVTVMVVPSLQLTVAKAASNEQYDGKDPSYQGCNNNAITAYSAPLKDGHSSTIWGYADLRYSTTCRTVWIRLRSITGGCIPFEDKCGQGHVHRNSDGHEQFCQIDQGGQTQCTSNMLGDANDSSFAQGHLDEGPYTASGKTPSY